MTNATTVTVAKESGQTTQTLLAQNLAKMISRLPPGPFGKAVWIVNNDVPPALQCRLTHPPAFGQLFLTQVNDFHVGFSPFRVKTNERLLLAVSQVLNRFTLVCPHGLAELFGLRTTLGDRQTPRKETRSKSYRLVRRRCYPRAHFVEVIGSWRCIVDV
jgi:hypothetical protein